MIWATITFWESGDWEIQFCETHYEAGNNATGQGGWFKTLDDAKAFCERMEANA